MKRPRRGKEGGAIYEHKGWKTGNEAVAEAMRQINPDVVAAYPITPQTEIVQIFSSFVANGKVDTEFVTVESEHSAMSATVGASAAGARAMTATSANGLAFMWEVVYIAAAMRLPIVMPVVNRALSGPLNIHCDHSDTMVQGILDGSRFSPKMRRKRMITPFRRLGSRRIPMCCCRSW